MRELRSRLLRASIAVAVAGVAFVLLAPLRCEPHLEIVETGPDIEATASQAGGVRCSRLLLPDYQGAAEPARWPAVLAAVALGVLVASVVRPEPHPSEADGPPRGEIDRDSD